MSKTKTIYKHYERTDGEIPCTEDWIPVMSWNEGRIPGITMWFSKNLRSRKMNPEIGTGLYRPISKEQFMNLYYDLKDLKHNIMNIIPEFFPENSDSLMYFEFLPELGKHVRHTYWKGTPDPSKLDILSEDEIRFGYDPKILWVFTKLCSENPEIGKKITDLTLGNTKPIGLESNEFNFPFWIWQYEERIGSILGNWDSGWDHFKFFWYDGCDK